MSDLMRKVLGQSAATTLLKLNSMQVGHNAVGLDVGADMSVDCHRKPMNAATWSFVWHPKMVGRRL